MTQSTSLPVAAVLIAKNEGERFRRSIDSLVNLDLAAIVYVDSGSTDGSQLYAKEKGVDVIEMDLSQIPFTHSRARNEGFEHVSKNYNNVEFIQFLDGDCEVFPDWLNTAVAFLEEHPEFSSVCGKRLEKHPEQSIYNTQINMEWQGEYGEVLACGGDFLIRKDDFASVGGFDPEFINGEDPELFIRLKKKGLRFFRLDMPMTEHDVNMTEFRQWWTRSYRCGHGYAHIFDVHGKLPQKYRRKQVISSLVYGALLPFLLLAALFSMVLLDGLMFKLTAFLTTVILLLYLRMILSAIRYRLKQGDSFKESFMYGIFTLIAKPAHFFGALTYLKKRMQGKGFEVIEYRK